MRLCGCMQLRLPVGEQLTHPPLLGPCRLPPRSQFGLDGTATKVQLNRAFPIHTYPYAILTPDGNIALASGKTLVRGRAWPAGGV